MYTPYYTGVILLFSGGTFLYIAAVHILPELIVCHLYESNGISDENDETMPLFGQPKNYSGIVGVGLCKSPLLTL